MADDTQRPSDLVSVSPSGYINTETTAGQQEQSNRPTDLVAVDPDYVANQVSPYNTVTGVAAGAGAVRPLIEKIAGSDATTRRSMETYLRSQRHHNLPGLDLAALEKEFQKLYSPDSRIATYSEVQDALKAVKGEVPGIPKADLSAYKTIAKPTTMSGKANQLLKKTGEVIEDVSVPGGGFAKQSFRAAGRGGLGFGAGYEGAEAYNKAVEGDLGAAIPHASSALGYAGLLATNPKIKGAGAVLAGLPLVGKYFAGDAQAAPMSKEDVTGTGFDLVTSLLGPASLALSPSQLGDSTLRQNRSNERYRPGMSVLEGTRLAPELRAEGGLVYLAEGGAPKKSRASIAGTLNEVGTVQGPNLSTMARDYIAQLPATTEKNLRNQQDVMDRAMPLTVNNGRIEFGKSDPEAMREMTDMVSGMGGITKAVGKPVINALSDLFDPVKKSGVQLAREANYVHDVRPTHNFSEPKKVSIQDLQGGVLVGVPGDRTLAGHQLLSVNGVPLSKAVDLHGGPRYGQRKADLGEDAFWASQIGAASALQNKAARAAETSKGNPVFGMYTAMAPDSSNYALHHTEALINQLDALSPNKAKLKAFDKMIKEDFPEFLGMSHPEIMQQFAVNSDLRKYVADRLNKSKIASEFGMPSGEATIHAITEPALRNVKTGTTGYSVGELNPFSKLKPELEHPTYDTQIPGQFKGQMIAQLPWQEYFPDVSKKIAANPRQAGPHAWGTFKMGDFHQPVTQELVDRISPLEEMVKSATKDFK